jgi:hypothetical protein
MLRFDLQIISIEGISVENERKTTAVELVKGLMDEKVPVKDRRGRQVWIRERPKPVAIRRAPVL